jgi:hypothetical protein
MNRKRIIFLVFFFVFSFVLISGVVADEILLIFYIDTGDNFTEQPPAETKPSTSAPKKIKRNYLVTVAGRSTGTNQYIERQYQVVAYNEAEANKAAIGAFTKYNHSRTPVGKVIGIVEL